MVQGRQVYPPEGMDTAEEGLTRRGDNNWKTKAAKETEWKNFVGAVKAGTGL
jgi:hypothetical protein